MTVKFLIEFVENLAEETGSPTLWALVGRLEHQRMMSAGECSCKG